MNHPGNNLDNYLVPPKTEPLSENKSGWYYVFNSPKWHYFNGDSQSVCGRWWVPGLQENLLEDNNDGSADNCKSCQKKVAKLRKLPTGN